MSRGPKVLQLEKSGPGGRPRLLHSDTIFDEAMRKHPFHDDAKDNGVDNPKFLVEKRYKQEAGG